MTLLCYDQIVLTTFFLSQHYRYNSLSAVIYLNSINACSRVSGLVSSNIQEYTCSRSTFPELGIRDISRDPSDGGIPGVGDDIDLVIGNLCC